MFLTIHYYRYIGHLLLKQGPVVVRQCGRDLSALYHITAQNFPRGLDGNLGGLIASERKEGNLA